MAAFGHDVDHCPEVQHQVLLHLMWSGSVPRIHEAAHLERAWKYCVSQRQG